MTFKKILFLAFALCGVAFAQGKQKIAVYVASNELNESDKRVLETNMLHSFLESGQYTAIERNNAFLSSIAQERNKQRDGTVDFDQVISRLGKEYGVQVVCVVDYAHAFEIRSFSARLINLESAEIIGFGETELNSNEIRSAADKVFKQMQKPANIGKSKIAVYVASKELNSSANRLLATKILASMIQSGQYTAIERGDAFLGKIVKEREKQRDGSVDNSQINSRLGKEAGIQNVLVVDYVHSRTFNSRTLSAHLINLESAEIKGSAVKEMISLNEIGSASDNIVEQIIEKQFPWIADEKRRLEQERLDRERRAKEAKKQEKKFKCEQRGCTSVRIDINNSVWSNAIFYKLRQYNRFDVATVDDNDTKYDYVIRGIYSKERVECQKGEQKTTCDLHNMNTTIVSRGKPTQSFVASCLTLRNEETTCVSDKIVERFMESARLEATVTDIDGREITINRGYNSDVKKGDVFAVLGGNYNDEMIGKIRIARVEADNSTAEKIRGNVFIDSPIKETKPFNPSSIYLSGYLPTVKSTYAYEGKELTRQGFSVLLGGEFLSENSFGGGPFIGGGALGNVTEFIFGGEVKKLLWLLEERIALPISLGLAGRRQSIEIENKLVAQFIDEPKFLQEGVAYLNEKRNMSRWNFDIMPSVDLQVFMGDNFSLYVGYMYRIAFARDFEFNYKILGKYYEEKKTGDSYTVPDEYNPLKDSKETIFGAIPGTLRVGIKIHIMN